MTVINFSTLNNSDTIGFDPATDILRFDNPIIRAASVELGYADDFTRVTLTVGDTTVHLASGVSLAQLTTGHLTFVNGSQLLIGDGLIWTTDDNFANTLATSAKADQLLGLGGGDTLHAGAGNDRLDGGPGADTMIGGPGNDTYIVDDAGDVVDEETLPSAPLLVSTDATGVQGNSLSYSPSLSPNGRYVAFTSGASNLVPGDTNNHQDIFVKDLETGTIQRVSTDALGVEGNSDSNNPSLSADGSFVLFGSAASSLIPGDTNNHQDIFIKDLRSGTLQRLSTFVSGEVGNFWSSGASFSADGQYVVFTSDVSGLVAGDTNNTTDLFVKDLQTGTIQRVSTDAAGGEGNDRSGGGACISANGRYVVFASYASNLVPGDTNNTQDLFVKDLETGAIRLISINNDAIEDQSKNLHLNASISADGRYVVITSEASYQVAEYTFYSREISVKDLVTGAGQQILRSDTGALGNWTSTASISADGRYVVFDSAAAIFVKDLQTGVVQCVSTDVNGVAGNKVNYTHSISADGRYIAFASRASNLVDGDTNNTFDIFTAPNPLLGGGSTNTVQASVSHTLNTNVKNLVLTGTAAINGSGNTLDNRLTGNSAANTLDGGSGADTMTGGRGDDLYLVDNAQDRVIEVVGQGIETVRSRVDWHLPGQVENLLLTGSADLAGEGNGLDNTITGNAGNNRLKGGAGIDTVSYDNASTAVMANLATRLATGFGTDTLFNFENLAGSRYDDRLTGNRANNVLDGGEGGDTLSGGLGADTLIGGLGNDTYIVDNSGDVVDEKTHPGGPQRVLCDDVSGVSGGYWFANASLSDNDRFVVFESNARNLVPGGAGIGSDRDIFAMDIFIKDLQAGVLRRVVTDANGVAGNGPSSGASLSADGRYVVFASTASNLVAGDSNNCADIFIKDLQTGTIQRVSTDAAGGESNGRSFDASLSTDGRHMVFESDANNLVAGDTNNLPDIFVKDMQTGEIQRRSTAVTNPSFSDDGRYVVFESEAGNLVAGDSNASKDIFVKDLQTGTLQRVSTDAAGMEGNSRSLGSSISADGRYVVFGSLASNLITGDTDNTLDIFIKDLRTGEIRQITTNSVCPGGGWSMRNYGLCLSADGHYVVFDGNYVEEVAGDTKFTPEIFTVFNPFLADDGVTDTVRASVSFTLTANVEDLVLTGTATINGTGNALDNRLTGNRGHNVLQGRRGDDTLSGGLGNDILGGGAGNDYLTGGSGCDTFLFNSPLDGATDLDTITDFDPIADSIRLEQTVFSILPSLGPLAEDTFRIGAAAADGDDYLVYDGTTGFLSYDADGAGSGDAVQIALLGIGLSLTNADFTVV